MNEQGHFAILKKPLPGMSTRVLPEGWVLSYQAPLRVQCSKDGRVVLLGIAWQFLPERGTPMEEIEKLCQKFFDTIPEEALLGMEESWCGRYVLLCQGVVYGDTCTLLPVFYSDLGVSSDCTLLAEQAGQPRKNYTMPPRRIMNWMPGPLTQYDGVCRMLPSQLYCYTTGEVRSRQLLAAHYLNIADENVRLGRIVACFDFSLHQMQDALPGTKLLVAITGGHDSRTLLALCKHAKVDFDAFTLLYDDIYEDDVTIPKELCRVEHIPHHEVPRKCKPDYAVREAEYLDHISGLVQDEDRLYYAHQQFAPLVQQFGEVALLRSGVWPNVMEWYRRSFTPTGPGFDCFDWFGAQPGSLEEKSLQEYFAWQEQHPQKGLSACNVFYWDQRNGCWLSAIETGFDLIDHVISLQPANCRYLMSMLMEFPAEERIINHHQYKIVAKACPSFSVIPYGGRKRQNESGGQVLKDKVIRGIQRLRKLGLRKTIKTYYTMIRTRVEEMRMLKKQGREH